MSLKHVLIEELRDMYSAENQLVKALPRLEHGANDKELAELFKIHTEETREQVIRLRTVFELLQEKATGEHCSGMEAVIEEGFHALTKGTEGAFFDAGLLGAALRTEHYEIAGYQSCIAMAEKMRLDEIVQLLTENLNEELAAAAKITVISESILEEAARENNRDTGQKSGRDKYSAKKSKEDEANAASAVNKHKK